MAGGLSRHFSKEDILVVNRHMKRCSILLMTREIEINTTTRYHLILVGMATIKKNTNNKFWKGCGERDTPYIIDGNVNFYSHCRKRYGGFSEKLKIELSCCCSCCLVTQLCPTFFNPMDCGPPGSSVHGILQARVPEWVAMPSSKGSSQPRD